MAQGAKELIRHYERRERDGYFRLNELIHEAIAKGCGNPILIVIYEGLGNRLHCVRYMVNLSSEADARPSMSTLKF